MTNRSSSFETGSLLLLLLSHAPSALVGAGIAAGILAWNRRRIRRRLDTA